MFPKPPLWIILLEIQIVCLLGYMVVRLEGLAIFFLTHLRFVP